nr:ETEC_3214 domain-containing protein [Streptomyces violaceoruber]
MLMYSLTTRSRLFRPRVSIGPHRITLGKTALAALPSPNVEDSGPWFELGARRFSYAEEHYFGNPGGYLRWVVGMSDAGSPLTPPVGCNGDARAAEDVAAYRHAARINSVLVIGPAIDLEGVLPRGIAPDLDTVRLLELRNPARVALTTRYYSAKTAVERWKHRNREFREGPLP